MEGVLAGEALRRAQAAWRSAQLPVEQRWAEGNPVSRDGRADLDFATYFDIPELMSVDDVFIDLIDSPKLVPLLSCVCGRGGLDAASSIAQAGAHSRPCAS